MKECIIIVPSLSSMGPVKGAIAIANGLNNLGIKVNFVALKKSSGANSFLNQGIKLYEFKYQSNLSFFSMQRKVRKLVDHIRLGNKNSVYIISICFIADLTNFFIRKNTKRISSIRGDLNMNYSMDYKIFGNMFANFHYFIVSFFDLVFAMNKEMKEVLIKKKCKNIQMIPNFINEIDFKYIKKSKDLATEKNIVFVGSLSKRKMPGLLIETVVKMIEKGNKIKLILVGDGPLKSKLLEVIDNKNLTSKIEIIGFHNNPIDYVKNADLLVLPSLSEGTPRAVMEALYVGIPCVMRNLSTNDNLVLNGENGYLFNENNDLEEKILKCIKLSEKLKDVENLLPDTFSQEICSTQLCKEISKI